MSNEVQRTEVPAIILEKPDFMPVAREFAAQCWCDDKTKHIEMNPELCEVMAEKLAGWMSTATEFNNAAQYYRNLLVQCGNHIGPEAFTDDSGGVHISPLVAKIPELVERLCAERKKADAN